MITGKSKKAALLGVFTALALALSYIEYVIPFGFIPVPGFKPGLANIAVMAAMYLFGPVEAIAVSALRTVLSLFLFSNINAFLYSLAGAALSLAVMILLKRTERFSEIGVSAAGAVCHNLGQTAVASLILRSVGIWIYFPLLMLAGIVTGIINGVIVRLILKPLEKIASGTHKKGDTE